MDLNVDVINLNSRRLFICQNLLLQLFEESLKGLETRQGSIVSGTVVAIQKGFVLFWMQA